MGKNNKQRRAAKKRRKAQQRGPQPALQPLHFAYDDHGNPLNLRTQPWETIYYDEPDFQHACRVCHRVSGIPIHSMRVNQDFLREHGLDSLPTATNHSCPHCGASVAVEARQEVGAGGATLHTIDRAALTGAGLVEWKEPLTVDLYNQLTGENFSVSVSGRKHKTLVVCDDCGLPFEQTGVNAYTTAADSKIEVDFVVGPCEHCGGFGHPLLTTVSDGTVITTSNSPQFANEMLHQLAEQVRDGTIDVGAAVSRLRAENRRPLTRLADWIEARPTNAMLAATLITVTASLLGPQIPQMTDDDRVETDRSYTEDEVTVIIKTILDHYDQTHQPPAKRRRPTSEPD